MAQEVSLAGTWLPMAAGTLYSKWGTGVNGCVLWNFTALYFGWWNQRGDAI